MKRMSFGFMGVLLVLAGAALFSCASDSEALRRGEDYFKEGDYDGAIAEFTEAIRINPNAYTYVNRGSAYGMKKDHDRALADFNEAIRLKPDDATAYIVRGAVYLQKGDYARARADWEKALQLNPNDASAREQLEKLAAKGY